MWEILIQGHQVELHQYHQITKKRIFFHKYKLSKIL